MWKSAKTKQGVRKCEKEPETITKDSAVMKRVYILHFWKFITYLERKKYFFLMVKKRIERENEGVLNFRENIVYTLRFNNVGIIILNL